MKEETEQALWDTHSALGLLNEKLALLRRSSVTPRDKYRIDDMIDWAQEARKCLTQIDLLMNRRDALLAMQPRAKEAPKDKRKMAFKAKPRVNPPQSGEAGSLKDPTSNESP